MWCQPTELSLLSSNVPTEAPRVPHPWQKMKWAARLHWKCCHRQHQPFMATMFESQHPSPYFIAVFQINVFRCFMKRIEGRTWCHKRDKSLQPEQLDIGFIIDTRRKDNTTNNHLIYMFMYQISQTHHESFCNFDITAILSHIFSRFFCHKPWDASITIIQNHGSKVGSQNEPRTASGTFARIGMFPMGDMVPLSPGG